MAALPGEPSRYSRTPRPRQSVRDKSGKRGRRKRCHRSSDHGNRAEPWSWVSRCTPPPQSFAEEGAKPSKMYGSATIVKKKDHAVDGPPALPTRGLGFL